MTLTRYHPLFVIMTLLVVMNPLPVNLVTPNLPRSHRRRMLLPMSVKYLTIKLMHPFLTIENPWPPLHFSGKTNTPAATSGGNKFSRPKDTVACWHWTCVTHPDYNNLRENMYNVIPAKNMYNVIPTLDWSLSNIQVWVIKTAGNIRISPSSCISRGVWA